MALYVLCLSLLFHQCELLQRSTETFCHFELKYLKAPNSSNEFEKVANASFLDLVKTGTCIYLVLVDYFLLSAIRSEQ